MTENPSVGQKGGTCVFSGSPLTFLGCSAGFAAKVTTSETSQRPTWGLRPFCSLFRFLDFGHASITVVIMTVEEEIDITMEDDYDEEADSDFDESKAANADGNVSSSSEDNEAPGDSSSRPKKRRKVEKEDDLGELDSGDEATIQKAKKKREKKKGKNIDDGDSADEGDTGWRAKTRSMREREKEEKKAGKLASLRGATVDVDVLWKRMNEGGGGDTTVPSSEGAEGGTVSADASGARERTSTVPKVPEPVDGEEMITIKRTYDFAGTIHSEEKLVPKSSAEARLYLAQQQSNKSADDTAESEPVLHLRRPLRKYSRFDPNVNNPEFKQKSWLKVPSFMLKGKDAKKVTVLDKTKIDWAAHVDQEGLKEELDVAAKAKEGYLGRMDFLDRIGSRREEEARQARLVR